MLIFIVLWSHISFLIRFCKSYELVIVTFSFFNMHTCFFIIVFGICLLVLFCASLLKIENDIERKFPSDIRICEICIQRSETVWNISRAINKIMIDYRKRELRVERSNSAMVCSSGWASEYSRCRRVCRAAAEGGGRSGEARGAACGCTCAWRWRPWPPRTCRPPRYTPRPSPPDPLPLPLPHPRPLPPPSCDPLRRALSYTDTDSYYTRQ